MAHTLEPHPGQPWLSPDEAVDRLRDEFAVVEVSREDGADTAGDIVAKLIELKAPQDVIDQAVAKQRGTMSVVVADDSTADDGCLRFSVQPEYRILIGYSSQQHEVEARPLLERCAAAFNYTITLI